MKKARNSVIALGLVALFSTVALAAAPSADPSQLKFRIEPMLVAPSHGPMIFVVAKNLGDHARGGILTLKAPDGWLLAPKEQAIDLPAGQVRRFGFNVQRATATPSNVYPLEAIFSEEGKAASVHKQDVVVATSPYFTPTIDGKTDDWEEAVAVRGVMGKGSDRKTTTVKTFWSRRAFSLLMEVEEDRFEPATLGKSVEDTEYGDAVQLAFGAEKPGLPKYEYLITAGKNGNEAVCYRLETEGKCPKWEVVEKAKCVVSRDGGVTRYECSIPFKAMRKTIRPSEGRAFCFSYLVHDPDGTGVRDWGASVGLWPSQRRPDAWTVWWQPVDKNWCPFTSRVPWGMCSSKY